MLVVVQGALKGVLFKYLLPLQALFIPGALQNWNNVLLVGSFDIKHARSFLSLDSDLVALPLLKPHTTFSMISK